MERLLAAIVAVGVALVLPQVVGLAASRLGRGWFPTVAWPLAASGTIGLLWAISFFAGRHAEEQARPISGVLDLLLLILLVLHVAVGSIFGVLDQRAQARMREAR
jgi:predicted Na+-dependent transporter